MNVEQLSFRKCCHTPISDLIRGRLTARLDWKTRLAESQLPDNVCETIGMIVGMARLWRSEKLSVTEELIAHFEDGCQRGRTYEQLLVDFGNPKLAAKLIQRSKERNRSMFGKIAKASGWTALAAGLVAGVLFLFLYLAESNPSVDYTAVLNADALKVADDEKAWPIYREAWIRHSFVNQKLDIYNQESEELARPGDDCWPDAVKCLESKRDLLEAFRRGAKLPAFGLELQSDVAKYSQEDRDALFPGWTPHIPSDDEPFQKFNNRLVMGILLPHVQAMRTAVRILHVDSRIAAENGDGQLVLDNIETMFGLARQTSETPVLVCSLVSVALANMSFDVVEEIVAEYPDLLSQEQLRHLQSMIAEQQASEYFHFEGERALAYDLFQNIFTDDGEGDGRMTIDGINLIYGLIPALTSTSTEATGTPQGKGISGLLAVTTTSRRETRNNFDEIIDWHESVMNKPFYEQELSSQAPLTKKLIEQGGAQEIILGSLPPAINNLRMALQRTLGRQEGVILGIAIERFEQANGKPPETLEELVPDYVAAIPLDRMTGNPVQYKTNADRPVIYSVGTDGDDDGGTPSESTIGYRNLQTNSKIDGDWILWKTKIE